MIIIFMNFPQQAEHQAHPPPLHPPPRQSQDEGADRKGGGPQGARHVLEQRRVPAVPAQPQPGQRDVRGHINRQQRGVSSQHAFEFMSRLFSCVDCVKI